jgi:2'-5' RNA ligase
VTPTLSAVVVAVPESEPLVGRLRSELDAAASWGVPAHVTVLFPFLPPAEIDDGVLAGLTEAVATVPGFATTFERVDWFGEDVLWLAPSPAAPFVALTAAVQARFGLAPYGGAYGDEPVPHLTVGHDAPAERLRAAAAELEPGLPVHARVRSARLIVGSRGGTVPWRTAAELPLGRS